MLLNGSGWSLQHVIIFSGCEQKYLDRILAEQEEGCLVGDAKSAVATIFLLKKHTKNVFFFCYHLPCSFTIFLNVYACLYAMVNSKEICEEIPFPSFSEKW